MQTPTQTERQALDAAIDAAIAAAAQPRPGDMTLPPIPTAWRQQYCVPGSSWLEITCGQHRVSFQRKYDSSNGTLWFGFESRPDQLGRVWDRHFHAVVDDFGDLVEVQ